MTVKIVFNRMMLSHFVFIMLILLSHEIPTELMALRLSYTIGAEKLFTFLKL